MAVTIGQDVAMSTMTIPSGAAQAIAFPAVAMRLRTTRGRLCELVLARKLDVLRYGPSPEQWYLNADDVELLVEAARPAPAELRGLAPAAAFVFRLLADWGGSASMRELAEGGGLSFTSVWRHLHALQERGLVSGQRNTPWALTEQGVAVAKEAGSN
jgi:uncharacterized membrane protein